MAKFRLKPPEITENDVEGACKDVLAYRGYKIHRNHVGVYRTLDGKRIVTIGEKGEPDYLALHAKYPPLYFEVKRPHKLPKPHQEEKIAELRGVYGLAVIVIDRVENLIEWLNENHENRSY